MSDEWHPETFGERLGKIRRGFHRRVTQAELANYIGVTPQAVSGWERDEAVPEFDKLQKIATFYDISIDSLFKHFEGVAYPSKTPAAPVVTAGPVSGEHLVGARDFPIYAAAQGGGEGFMLVHTDVMEYVKRPAILEGVPDSYGILVVGESMVPAYRPGDMALVHPRRPVERERDVVLYDHDHRTGDAKAMIKHLISFDDRRYRLQQFNPPKSFFEHRADWPICHQVVGKYNGRR